MTLIDSEQSPQAAFMDADKEFSDACRQFNEAHDRLWKAKRKRSDAWNALVRSHGEQERTADK